MELNNNGETLQTQNPHSFYNDDDDVSDFSNCSTPYVSAPSSPGRCGGPPISGFFYSAPASPMHLLMTSSSSSHSTHQMSEASSAAEFEFSARFGSTGSGPTGPMCSADELFLDGKIRPMKLSTHLEQPQPSLIDLNDEEDETDRIRGRDPRGFRSRRTRSMSPMRNMSLVSEIYLTQNETSSRNGDEVKDADNDDENADDSEKKKEMEVSGGGGSGSSSRSSSAGRNSKRWVFLKEFLHRSKSEGRTNTTNNINKLWGTNLFSGSGKESSSSKKAQKKEPSLNLGAAGKASNVGAKKAVAGKPANGVVGKRRNAPSLHELHYTANRAQAEEMRKKTYLPYRQGLLGCLGFSSKGYGAAMNTGFARALNPVSSR